MATRKASLAGVRRRTGGGSTVKTRQQVLEALAAVRVATAVQIRTLSCPGTASEATVRGGLQDLARDGLVCCVGRTLRWRGDEEGRRASVKVWSLTPAGAAVLAARAADVTAPAGAAAAGAPHALAVTDTVAALLQVPAVPTGPTPHGPGHTPLRRHAVGVGALESVRTHVPVPPTGASRTTADIVLRAPADRVPLLLAVVESRAPGTPPVEQRLEVLAGVLRARASTSWTAGMPLAVAVVLSHPTYGGFTVGTWLPERRKEIVESVRAWPASVPLLFTEHITVAGHGPLARVWLRAGVTGAFSLTQALESGSGAGT